MNFGNGHGVAILWVLASTAIWTFIFAIEKLIDIPITALQIQVLRYAGSMAVLLLIARRQGGLARYRSARPAAHFLRACCGSGAALAITWSSARMPLADATAISMTAGVLVVLLGVFVLHERVTARHWSAVVLVLLGAGVVAASQGAFGQHVLAGPAMVAGLSAALFAVDGLLIRVLSLSEPALGVMLHVTAFGLLLVAGPAIVMWQPMPPGLLIFCLALGPVAIVAQFFTIQGYRMAPLSVVGPVDYAWLVFAALLGFVAFGEVPGPGVLGGAVLIVLGGVWLARLTPATPIEKATGAALPDRS